jgi:rhodanese-related sulfurtransferase
MSFENITASACKKIIDEYGDNVIVLDVRSEEEFDRGKILNAKNIPLNELAVRENELQKDQKIIIYCASGNRSRTACSILQSHGFVRCMNLDGGLLAWNREGFYII